MNDTFIEEELWSLDHTIAKFIVPRLKKFQQLLADPSCVAGPPHSIAREEWALILNRMIYSFDKISSDTVNYSDDPKIQEGIDLFAKWYRCLWW